VEDFVTLNDFDPEEFQHFIESGRVVTKAELEKLLHFYAERSPVPPVTCQFYLMKCTGTEFREDNLIQFMLRKSIYCVLEKREYRNAGLEDGSVHEGRH